MTRCKDRRLLPIIIAVDVSIFAQHLFISFSPSLAVCLSLSSAPLLLSLSPSLSLSFDVFLNFLVASHKPNFSTLAVRYRLPKIRALPFLIWRIWSRIRLYFYSVAPGAKPSKSSKHTNILRCIIQIISNIPFFITTEH